MGDKVIIVTGASRGIGAAIAKKLVKEQFKVVGTYHSSSNLLDELRKEMGENADLFIPARADVRLSKDCEEVVEIAQNAGQLYGLVNNAGITRDMLLVRMTDDAWNDVLTTNLTGAFNITKLCAKVMMKNREGSIVNISSIVGLRGNSGQANYAAAKAGLIGFTQSLAKELGPRNIRVNAVAPGFIETDMTAKLPPEIREEALKQISLKRFGKPDEVAEVVYFLLSEKSSYITGAIIEVSGGISL